jgi:mitochondrial inner membrane protein COX18
MLAQLSQPPTPFDSESFFTLTSLALPDPTNMLPLLTGIITLANVESSQWFRTSEQKERDKKVETWTAERRARGETVIRPKDIFINALRGLSIVRIIIGFSLPGVSFCNLMCGALLGLANFICCP